MAKVFVTYGFGTHQEYCYSEVDAPTEKEAYERIFEETKMKYSFTYSPEEFAGQVERFGLTKIPLTPMVKRS